MDDQQQGKDTMDAFRRAADSLRTVQNRFAEVRRPVAVQPAMAHEVAANIATIVGRLEKAIAMADSFRAVNAGEVETLMDWGARLDAYAGKIAAADPATTDVIRGLAAEVGKMADARKSTPG